MAPSVQNPTPAQALALLPKLSDADADLRYMSLNDLYDILDAGAPNFLITDYHTSAKIIDGILMTLDDQNGEVQNQAIKCIAALVVKLPPDILSPFIHRTSNIKTTNSVDTSIIATALRTFITAFPRPLAGLAATPKSQDAYSAISRVLIPRLLGYIVIPLGLENLPSPPPGLLEIGSDKGANTDAVDIMIEVIRCFGPMLQDAEKQAFQTSTMSILDDDRTGSVVKKKAVVAISLLAVYMSDRLLSIFVSEMAENFRSPQLNLSKRRLLIAMVGSLSRSIPQRLGPHVKTIAPFVLLALSEQEYEDAIEDLNEEGAPNAETEEVREAALIALEGLLASCSNDMRAFTNESIDAALRYVTYDPNTTMDEDDEEMGGTQGENDEDAETNGINDEEEADFEEDEAMSDDDDASWKVRRCATKALYAIISTRSNGDLLDNGTLYSKVAPVLVKCFNEREENVRLEVLATLASLIKKTGEGIAPVLLNVEQEIELTTEYASRSRKRRRIDSDAGSFDVPGVLPLSMGLASPTDSPSPSSGPKADLAQLSPAIIRGIAKLLKQNSVPTKQAAIVLLRDLILVHNGALSDSLSKVIEPLVDAVKSSGTSSLSTSTSVSSSAAASGSKMRIETLQLISAICDTHSSKIISPYIGTIVPSVITATKDKNYKVSSDALLSIESIVKVLTPPRTAGSEQQRRLNLGSIYDIVLTRAMASDTDLEVRSRALHALGILLARTSGSSNAKLLPSDRRSKALDVLQDRLKNETTRISAIKAIDLVAASAVDQNDLQPPWLQDVTLELGAQLRKADRRLRGASLTAIRSLVTNPVIISNLDDSTVRSLSGMLLLLLNAEDLHLLGLSLSVLGKLVTRNSKIVDTNLNNTLYKVVLSPLGGTAFDAYLDLIKVVGDQAVGKPLMQGLLQNVGVSGDPAVVGKAIGTLLVAGGSTVGVNIDDFVNELRSSKDSQRKCLALAILGEAGLRLGSKSPLEPGIFTTHFNSKSESVPRAAAIALGRAGAGSVRTYLPVILSNAEKAGNLQYLSLHSIKEILQYAGKAQSDISPYTNQIWQKLLAASQAEDNKAIGAECIGRLTIVEPKSILPLLQSYLRDPVPTVRGMVIQAVRFTLADSDEGFDDILKPNLVNMLTTMLNDTSLENRRLALTTLNSATTNRSVIILPHLGQLIPLVIKESKPNPDFIREVQMGPFKHKVDDGLELRKSAYETLYSLMEHAYTRMSPLDLFDRVVAGIEDEHEIKVLCNLMVTKLIVLDPGETCRRLDAIADRYRAILSFKPKENAVKQEIEKAAEASKGVLKVSILLHNAFPAAAGANTNVQGQAWRGYWEWVWKDFKTQIASMENEAKSQAA